MNFLFLSKLIPLFIYPLGLACILLIIALIVAWKYPRWTSIPIATALIVLLLGGNGWITNWLVQSLEWQNLPQNLPNADAIVILGGATRSAHPPRPMADVTEQGDRIIYGLKLYQEGKAPIIIASGGRVEWRGGGQPESEDMQQLLELMGVPSNAIIQEPNSLNTYENAVNVSKILADKGIKKILLVTSAMHIPRSLLIFKHQGIEAIAAPTDFLVSQQELAEINSTTEAVILNLLPDVNRMDKTTKAMKEYIGTFIYWLKGWL
jgi:uncharacterized SAM-binding protein YcdF (DUF218 family)